MSFRSRIQTGNRIRFGINRTATGQPIASDPARNQLSEVFYDRSYSEPAYQPACCISDIVWPYEPVSVLSVDDKPCQHPLRDCPDIEAEAKISIVFKGLDKNSSRIPNCELDPKSLQIRNDNRFASIIHLQTGYLEAFLSKSGREVYRFRNDHASDSVICYEFLSVPSNLRFRNSSIFDILIPFSSRIHWDVRLDWSRANGKKTTDDCSVLGVLANCCSVH